MRFSAGMLALGLFLAAGSAQAQLDCTGGVCTTTKYGLGADPGFRHEELPTNFDLFNHADFGPNLPVCVNGPTPGVRCESDATCGAGGLCNFGIAYYYNRGDTQAPLICDGESSFNPLPGQVRLRELTACTTPTSEGPKCVAGANAGRSCHLGANEPFASLECPSSTCADTAGSGCRVEIPISDGGKSNPGDTSEYWITTRGGAPGFFDLSALTGNTFGGTSAPSECTNTGFLRKACSSDADCGAVPGSCAACFSTNIRQKPSMGTRYLLPDSRRTALGLPAGATYIRWDKGLPEAANPAQDLRPANSTAFRTHQDDAAVCCNSVSPTFCAQIGFKNYPLLWRPTCTALEQVKNVIHEDNFTPDWIFEAGRNSRLFTDPNFEIPGEVWGVCLNNRDVGCTRTGTECAGLADTCDFREPGFRIQVSPANIRDLNGDPNPGACGSALAVLRAAPSTGCTIQPRFPVDGDPGADCGTFNYGVDQRLDADCNGAADVPVDKCPFLAEWDSAADSDGDCAISTARCRGDECECGDSTLNGHVTVSDIVETNLMIFGAIVTQRLGDSNSDLRVNVSDIVATNQELFSPDSSTCRHITSIRCGNNVLDSGEACDDGAQCAGGATPGALCDASGLNTCGNGTCERVGGDGCNRACRVEFGWSCSGSPSVCTNP